MQFQDCRTRGALSATVEFEFHRLESFPGLVPHIAQPQLFGTVVYSPRFFHVHSANQVLLRLF